MDYLTYCRILKNVKEKSPIESGIQALIYILVLEVLKDKKELDVVMIDDTQNHSVFMSYGGISDIAIVDSDFTYNREFKEEDRKKIKICIEVKGVKENISCSEYTRQVKMQLLTYKRAIITNGRDWHFYKYNSCDYDKDINKVIDKENKLANEKRDRTSLYISRTWLIKKNNDVTEVSKKIEEKTKNIDILEKAITVERKEIDNKMKKEYGSIEPQCFTINNEEDLNSLCDKLKNFIVDTPI